MGRWWSRNRPSKLLEASYSSSDRRARAARVLVDSPMSVYDPHSDSWTFEEVDWSVGRYVVNACVHESRMIGFSRRAGYVDQWERATDGSWSLSSCEVDTSGLQDFVSESVILG